MRRGTSHLLALLVATGSACAGNQAAQHLGEPPVRRVPADRLFELRSSFWLNLHHFLYVQARARLGRDRARPEVVASLGDTAGAYTTERPAHIMISSTAEGYRGTLGLEMLFHEAMHTLEDSLASTRARARQATGKRMPYDVVHAIIFYTAGEITRRVVPAHRPYIAVQGLRTRGSLARHFPLLERHWRPYLDARTSFSDAFAAIVAEL